MIKADHSIEQADETRQPQLARSEWANARRVVVKIGSSLLVDRASGQLKAAWLESLAEDVAALNKAGKDAIVVSSGAIALGRHLLSFGTGSLALEQSQAAAAVGLGPAWPLRC